MGLLCCGDGCRGFLPFFYSLVSRYEEKKMRLAEIQEKIADAEATGEVLQNFIQTLRDIGDMVTEFDESLWASLVECVTVYGKERAMFLFKGGTEIKIGTDYKITFCVC